MTRRVAVLVVAAGLAGAAVVAVIAARGSGGSPLSLLPAASVVSASGEIDYNCNLPGTGCPWLEHMPPSQWDTGGSDLPIEILDGAHWQGIFFTETRFDEGPYVMWLPAVIGPSGPSMPDVYRTICAVHPDLGGSGLRRVSADELETLVGQATVEVANLPIAEPRWLTDDVTRAADEAHMGFEPMRLFWLPVLPEWAREDLTSGSCAPAAVATTTTTKPGTQRWQVAVSGYEIDLMERYWRLTTRVRGAVRFDYTLQAEFTLRREDGRWVFDSGTITYAEVGLSEEYWPEGAWEITWPVDCPKCDQITSGRSLTGEVIGDDVRLSWGTFRPDITVHAKIVASCTPMPDCSEWKNRIFTSSQFFQSINGELLNLSDGAVLAPSTVDPASGLQWLDYTITLRQLDGG